MAYRAGRSDKFPPCRCGEADWDNAREEVVTPRRDDERAERAVY